MANFNNILAIAKSAESGYREPYFTDLKTYLEAAIAEAGFTADNFQQLNKSLASQHRRKIEIDDITKIAYVHLRSIKEHEDGASPVSGLSNTVVARAINTTGCT